jgi:MFS transporter, DHA1 family, multidrug resistance protein
MQMEISPTVPAEQSKSAMQQTLPSLRQSIFLISLPFGILGFVLPVYGKAIGAGALQIGLFFSIFFLMLVILRPLVGAGLDRFGRRPFFLAGLAGYALSMAIFAFSGQVWHILLARTVQGIASALMWLAAQAMTADEATTEQRGRSFGRVAQSSMQGSILGTFIGFSLLVPLGIAGGWKLLFSGYGLVAMLALLRAWRTVKETRRPAFQIVEQPIRWTRPWILLLLVTMVTGAAWAMLEPVMMIFLQERLTTQVDILALAMLPAALVWALLPARLGGLADRFGRKPLMVLGMAAAAVTSFLIPGLTSLAGMAGLWALQALCYAAGDPAEQALVADLTGGNQHGRAYGLYSMAASLGAMVGPLAGGWLYDAVGQAAPFYANGIVLAICTLALAVFLREPAKSN